MSRGALTPHSGEAYAVSIERASAGGVERRLVAVCGTCPSTEFLPDRDISIPPIAVRQKFARIWLASRPADQQQHIEVAA